MIIWNQASCTRCFLLPKQAEMEVSIVPYRQSYDPAIEKLERKTRQGQQIKLKILKDHFLSRACVFSKYNTFLAINHQDRVIATAISAQTKIKINHKLHDCCIGFDVKVESKYRNHGIGRKLARQIIQLSKAEGIIRHMVTMKSSNIPVIRLLSKATTGLWFYSFVYLTIPTRKPLDNNKLNLAKQQQFKITLFDHKQMDTSFYATFPNGLACFFTHKLYRLQVDKISWFYKLGLHILKLLKPSRYSQLPDENDEMNFATLFNHTGKNIENLNEVLSFLHKNNIQYLQVCCSKNDSIYQFLKLNSISTYSYTLVTDFQLSAKDQVTLDVRCL